MRWGQPDREGPFPQYLRAGRRRRAEASQGTNQSRGVGSQHAHYHRFGAVAFERADKPPGTGSQRHGHHRHGPRASGRTNSRYHLGTMKLLGKLYCFSRVASRRRNSATFSEVIASQGRKSEPLPAIGNSIMLPLLSAWIVRTDSNPYLNGSCTTEA